MDARKRQIILDNSSTYLKGTNVYINDNRTLMQQKKVRERVAARKAKMEKKKNKSETEKAEKDENAQGGVAHGTNQDLHIMYCNCRGFPWHKVVETDALSGEAHIIMLGETWERNTCMIMP